MPKAAGDTITFCTIIPFKSSLANLMLVNVKTSIPFQKCGCDNEDKERKFVLIYSGQLIGDNWREESHRI